jgi:hypothetical protein
MPSQKHVDPTQPGMHFATQRSDAAAPRFVLLTGSLNFVAAVEE